MGDRIRMNSISSPRAYMRSLATRDSEVALSAHVQDALDICKAAAFDFIILESAGVGQSDASILDYCDVSLYVMTPEYGAASQLEKINMLDYADVVAINKFDKAGALDALHDVRKQYKRNHQLWTAKDEELPIVGTIAAQFNDAGVNELFEKLVTAVEKKTLFGCRNIMLPEIIFTKIIDTKPADAGGCREGMQWKNISDLQVAVQFQHIVFINDVQVLSLVKCISYFLLLMAWVVYFVVIPCLHVHRH